MNELDESGVVGLTIFGEGEMLWPPEDVVVLGDGPVVFILVMLAELSQALKAAETFVWSVGEGRKSVSVGGKAKGGKGKSACAGSGNHVVLDFAHAGVCMFAGVVGQGAVIAKKVRSDRGYVMEDVGVWEEVVGWGERVSVEESADGLGVCFEGKRKAATWGGSLQKVSQSKAAIASKKMEAYGRGAGAGVVGETVRIIESAIGRIVFVGAVFMGLKLPGADARVCC